MPDELLAKCSTCPKEITVDIDGENALSLFTFRMMSHCLQFRRHVFEVSLQPKQ